MEQVEVEEPTPPEPEGCPVEEFEKWNKTSNDKINAVESADKVVVPVPKGYTASSLKLRKKSVRRICNI